MRWVLKPSSLVRVFQGQSVLLLTFGHFPRATMRSVQVTKFGKCLSFEEFYEKGIFVLQIGHRSCIPNSHPVLTSSASPSQFISSPFVTASLALSLSLSLQAMTLGAPRSGSQGEEERFPDGLLFRRAHFIFPILFYRGSTEKQPIIKSFFQRKLSQNMFNVTISGYTGRWGEGGWGVLINCCSCLCSSRETNLYWNPDVFICPCLRPVSFSFSLYLSLSLLCLYLSLSLSLDELEEEEEDERCLPLQLAATRTV
jgi:hypothetical protein